MVIKWYTRENNNLDKVLLKLFPNFTCHYLITHSSKLVFNFSCPRLLRYLALTLPCPLAKRTKPRSYQKPLFSMAFDDALSFRYRIKRTLLKPSANGRNIVGCYMLRRLHTLLCVVGSCCEKFETGQTLSYVQADATAPNNARFAQGLRASWRLVFRTILSRDKTPNFRRDLTSLLLTSGVLNTEATKLSVFVCLYRWEAIGRKTNKLLRRGHVPILTSFTLVQKQFIQGQLIFRNFVMY